MIPARSYRLLAGDVHRETLPDVLQAGDGGDGFVEDEEEVVDDDAGDGDVEPDGKRPASDGFVAREAGAQSEGQRDEDKRDDGGGENCVADKNGEIRWANRAVAGEADESGAMVKIQIEKQEAGGARDGEEHANFMRENLAAANEEIAGAQKDGARAVENCVEARESAKRNQTGCYFPPDDDAL
jgi:hypothetical protein